MATDPHRRENLLESATAYRRRILLQCPVPDDWVKPQPNNEIASKWLAPFCGLGRWELLLGCRPTGGWSLHFDLEPVLQFNSGHQLRRLYANGQRYAADRGSLKVMHQQQSGGRMQFLTEHVDSSQAELICESCLLFLKGAVKLINQAQHTVVGQIPYSDTGLLADAVHMLEIISQGFTIASSPGAD